MITRDASDFKPIIMEKRESGEMKKPSEQFREMAISFTAFLAWFDQVSSFSSSKGARTEKKQTVEGRNLPIAFRVCDFFLSSGMVGE